MGFPFDRSPNDPKATIQYGRDFNFFQKISITNTTFNTDADMVITFPTFTTTFQLESGAGIVQYSFNGIHVHGDMTPFVVASGSPYSANLSFVNRPICKIWFLTSTGTSVVRVESWGIR